MDDDHWSDPDDEGYAEGEQPEDNAMEATTTVEGEDEALEETSATTFFCPACSEQQGSGFSKHEMDDLMKCEPYQKRISTCHLCNQCWFDDQSTENCPECDGYGLTRPCPVCQGQCGATWKRNIRTSHAFHKAHWEGKCLLSQEMQDACFLRLKTESNEETISEGMQDLSTT